jgi:dCMP deaminase
MRCAHAIAGLSHAERKKVGAILVSLQGIIAEGYNGTPSGFDNVCEIKKFNPLCMDRPQGATFTHYLETKPEVLHAESNAIAKVAKSTNSSLGATLYVTCSPCFECSKMIIQAGIKRVVYEEEYRLVEGLALLRQANIEVVKL